MNPTRRRFLTAGVAFAALAAVPGVAHAGQVLPFRSGNPVTDMIAAANDNAGLARKVGGRLAVAAGEAAAGTSIWRKLLSRTALGKAVTVATLAGVAYDLYRYGSGLDDFRDGPPPAEEPGVSYTVALSKLPEGRDSTYLRYGDMPIGSCLNYVNQYRERYSFVYGYVLASQFTGANNYARGVLKAEGNTPAGFEDYERVIVDGVEYIRGSWIFTGHFPDPVHITLSSAGDARLIAFPSQGVQSNVVKPSAVPDKADVSRLGLADLLNQFVAEAIAKDPQLAAEVGTAPRITPEQVAELLPEGSPLGQVGTSRSTMMAPARDPFTGASTEPGSIADSDPATSTPDPTDPYGLLVPPTAIPDVGEPPAANTVQVDQVTVREGVPVCPAIPAIGAMPAITSHCGPIIEHRSKIVAATRLASYAVVFNYVLRD